MARDASKSKVRTIKSKRFLYTRKSAGNQAPARLVRRLGNLTLSYVSARGTPTALQQAVVKLKDDVDVWGKRTGRRDLRAFERRMRGGGSGWSCRDCEWIMVSRGRLCFLVGCDPEYKNCSYICFDLPTPVSGRP